MGLSQCSRPVSPVDPLVPAAPCTTLPPFPCLVPVIPPCAKAALDTSAPAIARPESRTARLALMHMPYLSLLEPARPVDFLGDTPPHAAMRRATGGVPPRLSTKARSVASGNMHEKGL